MPTLWLLVPQLSHDFVLLVALNLTVIFKVNLFSISRMVGEDAVLWV